jgi:adenosylmethionine-8-amino-7-oxononanoate aminotransferase
MARQYFIDSRPAQPQRTKYIAREHSYHGNTIGALSLSGHLARRAIYEPILTANVSWISACNPYRQQLPGETIPEFVSRKAEELDAKFQSLGPETVIAFVCEPVPGASLGCIPPPPGYLAAMKAVCRKYGALFILDEVMSGMGRTGTLHAWQSDHDPSDPTQDCVPDIQMVGKGLGGGYQPIAGVLAGHDVINTLSKGTGAFVHGQTYQAHPVACAAALAVQRIIQRDNLLSNVKTQGEYLESLLRKHLDAHPSVGNIRGRGVFWGIEFVENKTTKKPFPQKLNVAARFAESALKQWSIAVYPGQGTVDGVQGDHVILAPAYIVQNEDVEEIVKRVAECANAFFEKLEAEIAATTAK